ncbi:helix-turn-helix transcriptional regulator [Streptomyces sp. NPDC050423]|uniref:helix-turn-helix transcriptional regulator n=1 Tax=Streptomyces sp. NPDC050423 TaxID=3155402 RepID=UPI0034218DFC
MRGLAEASGVNRQAIADLLAGRSWPDVATVARLGTATGTALWPQAVACEREIGHEASLRVRTRSLRDRT